MNTSLTRSALRSPYRIYRVFRVLSAHVSARKPGGSPALIRRVSSSSQLSLHPHCPALYVAISEGLYENKLDPKWF